MTTQAECLRTTGFNLTTAVFLAEACAAAYNKVEAQKFASSAGLANFNAFDASNVQGFWCADDKATVLAFRGTSNIGQWIRDVRVLPAAVAWGWAHLGFVQGIEEIEARLQLFDALAKTRPYVWIVGHSLGGALAVIAAARAKSRGIYTPELYTFGQPAVSFAGFADRFDRELPKRLWRLINQVDIVPRVPPFYQHCGGPKHIVRPGVLESLPGLEAAAGGQDGFAAPRKYTQEETLSAIILAPRQSPGTESVSSGEIIDENDPRPLDMLEFGRLQMALGAGDPPGLEGLPLEGALPYFADHQISEYIRLLKELRDRQS
ncbi:lipase family protein [uncultured Rhodoblastus sp.]|uniref:lipase family protein n=1 Tax=uncultured Rhodoblastus sp. TaxID=543037 RepID=UPI0025E8EEBC|nr:lipase family protein [uncultured Rhodoblastus sp.]